ncbi:hypothetical protein BCY86_05490 [Pajaroellobacter abortibovis]|uniref:Peptidase M19 n=2 Tax=Pajaroellobacter abortibovis TaxID=1882918 RepID=A0A1L6MX92_9BACT|nr:hypothetical protein BCY86_05490 [Pajaroellobacter abortibovis]
MEVANAARLIGVLLGIEGTHALDGDREAIGPFGQRDVRYVGLLHVCASRLGFPAYEYGRQDHQGLTSWGKGLIEQCTAHRVLIDLAHVNSKGFEETYAPSIFPPIVSHTGAHLVFRHWRNIEDDQIRATAQKGGASAFSLPPNISEEDG